MFAAYSRTAMQSEHLWTDFITSPRPQTIRSWKNTTLHEWKDLLMKKRLEVKYERTVSTFEEIINILYWDDYANRKCNNEKNKI